MGDRHKCSPGTHTGCKGLRTGIGRVFNRFWIICNDVPESHWLTVRGPRYSRNATLASRHNYLDQEGSMKRRFYLSATFDRALAIINKDMSIPGIENSGRPLDGLVNSGRHLPGTQTSGQPLPSLKESGKRLVR